VDVPAKSAPFQPSELIENESVPSRAEFDARYDAWFPLVSQWFAKRLEPGPQAEEAIREVFVRGLDLFSPSPLSEAQRATRISELTLTVSAEIDRQRTSTNGEAVRDACPCAPHGQSVTLPEAILQPIFLFLSHSSDFSCCQTASG
jgi:hypothetical protein